MEVLNNFQTFVVHFTIDRFHSCSVKSCKMAIPILAGHICNFTNDLNTVFSLKKRGKLVLPLGLLGNNDFFPDNQKLLFYCERIGVT
jgi:hypothetical protein